MNEKIKLLRMLSGESLEVFSEKAGIPVEKLTNLESGKELPNVRDLWTMCTIYGVKMEFFMGEMV